MNTAEVLEPAAEPRPAYYGPDGSPLDHKPEALTHLRGRRLASKDHPVIVFRGKLDSLAARIIEAQQWGLAAGNDRFVDELEEVLDFVRRLLSCEYTGQKVDDQPLLGMSADDLRERSHDPARFYGRGHLMASCRMGRLSVTLNSLRAYVREVETAAVAAFQAGGGPPREDIVRALNRLSSLFYIMIYQYLPKNFTGRSAGI